MAAPCCVSYLAAVSASALITPPANVQAASARGINDLFFALQVQLFGRELTPAGITAFSASLLAGLAVSALVGSQPVRRRLRKLRITSAGAQVPGGDSLLQWLPAKARSISNSRSGVKR